MHGQLFSGKLIPMKLLLTCCVMLVFVLVGCGEEESTKTSTYNDLDWDKLVSAERKGRKPGSDPPAASYGGIKVTIKPQNPIVGDCLEASIKGRLSDRTFVWEVNGITVQQDGNNRYCLKDAYRGDVVSVSVGDAVAGGLTSVKVGNSPPRVLDTTIGLISEGGEAYLEITPEVEDLDDDYVMLTYQWLINGEPNEEFTEHRLPDEAYQQGDKVQIRIMTNDGYVDGPTYLTRDINVPSAPPTFTSIPPASFEAKEYTYQVEAVDAEGGALTYCLEEAPEGMTIDVQTGKIVWPLMNVSPGEYEINIAVTDSDGSKSNQVFMINIGR
jgi:hypothetical protein